MTERRLTPGWTELGVGLTVLLVLEIGLARAWFALEAGPVATAIFMAGLSAVVAGGAFAAAVAVRVRRPSAFGLVRTRRRWVAVGVAGGLIAVVVKIPVTMAFTALFGPATSAQLGWSASSEGGIGAVVVSMLLLSVLTPIGEELFFRGVVTTVLMRYGAFVGVVGSTVIFAVLHGEPIIMVSAVLVGLPAAELRRRTGSVWPGAALHITFNLVSTIGLLVILPGMGA